MQQFHWVMWSLNPRWGQIQDCLITTIIHAHLLTYLVEYHIFWANCSSKIISSIIISLICSTNNHFLQMSFQRHFSPSNFEEELILQARTANTVKKRLHIICDGVGLTKSITSWHSLAGAQVSKKWGGTEKRHFSGQKGPWVNKMVWTGHYNWRKDPLKREVDLFHGDFQELLPCG